MRPGFAGRRRLWAEGGSAGVRARRPKLAVEVVKRSDPGHGFKVLPRRWVGARTLGWRRRHRRLGRDSETAEASAEAFVFLALIRIQIRRLA